MIKARPLRDQRWVYGSVAELLRSACVPVLVVRAPGCIPGM